MSDNKWSKTNKKKSLSSLIIHHPDPLLNLTDRYIGWWEIKIAIYKLLEMSFLEKRSDHIALRDSPDNWPCFGEVDPIHCVRFVRNDRGGNKMFPGLSWFFSFWINFEWDMESKAFLKTNGCNDLRFVVRMWWGPIIEIFYSKFM